MPRGFRGVNVDVQVNKVQTKILSANITTDGAITDLTFNNLVVGKWYQLSGRFRLQADVGAANDDQVVVNVTHNAVIIDTMELNVGGVDIDLDTSNFAINVIFKAAATTVTFVAVTASAASRIAGDGTRTNTYVQIEERNDLGESNETSAFT